VRRGGARCERDLYVDELESGATHDAAPRCDAENRYSDVEGVRRLERLLLGRRVADCAVREDRRRVPVPLEAVVVRRRRGAAPPLTAL
jgi:hypothetical protein